MTKPVTTRKELVSEESIDNRGDRRTIIPTPRSNGMFSGWGVRF